MNFPLIMLILLVITGGIALLDRYVLSRRRAPDAQGPWWVEYPKSFFPSFSSSSACVPSWWSPSKYRPDR